MKAHEAVWWRHEVRGRLQVWDLLEKKSEECFRRQTLSGSPNRENSRDGSQWEVLTENFSVARCWLANGFQVETFNTQSLCWTSAERSVYKKVSCSCVEGATTMQSFVKLYHKFAAGVPFRCCPEIINRQPFHCATVTLVIRIRGVYSSGCTWHQ